MPPAGATANQSKQAKQNLASLGRQLRLVLLDRDGVVNAERKSFVKTADEWHPIPGAISAIAALQKKFAVAICSNQSGIGRGLFAEADLAAMHDKLNQLLVDAGGSPVNVFYCPHTPQDGCACRKPKPELLQLAMRGHVTNPTQAIYVGDSEKDLLAASNANCHGALVLTGKGNNTFRTEVGSAAAWVYADLKAFTDAFSHV